MRKILDNLLMIKYDFEFLYRDSILKIINVT